MWEALWRRTVTLAREDPVLWFPVLAAEFAGFELRINKLAAILLVNRLLSWMVPGHSVLIGSVGYPNGATASTPLVVAAVLISFVVQFAPIVLYTIAFFITAQMVLRRAGFASSGEEFRVRRKIVALSIRGLLVGCAAGIAIALVTFAFVRSRWEVAGLPRTIFTDVLGGLVTGGAAYVMVPPAMRLLAKSVDESAIRLGRKCAVAAVTASTGLLILERIVVGVIWGSYVEIRMIQAIESLVAALPYAPLYIALSLLAWSEPTEIAEDTRLLPNEAGGI